MNPEDLWEEQISDFMTMYDKTYTIDDEFEPKAK